jgi:hypothetical protein
VPSVLGSARQSPCMQCGAGAAWRGSVRLGAAQQGLAGLAPLGPDRIVERGRAWRGSAWLGRHGLAGGPARRGSARRVPAGRGWARQAWLGGARRGGARRGGARRGGARQAGHGWAGLGRQGTAGRGSARRGKAWQGEAGLSWPGWLNHPPGDGAMTRQGVASPAQRGCSRARRSSAEHYAARLGRPPAGLK